MDALKFNIREDESYKGFIAADILEYPREFNE